MSPSRQHAMRAPHRSSAGFTLIELAIVLVIVGLLLGGVFKGQALIDNARVRSMASELAGIQSAWYAFQDRYRAIPGDFRSARSQINRDAIAGDGNGRIENGDERAAVWQHLALAGYINGSFGEQRGTTGSAADTQCSSGTCPKNPFESFYKISYSDQAVNRREAAHEIFTGDQIPVGILAELDRKIDDGIAVRGRFRVHKAFVRTCTSGDEWDVAGAGTNCAGVLRQ